MLLASGDYGKFKDDSKSSIVTITAQSGAVASIEFSLTPADHLTFDGLTIKGAFLMVRMMS